MQTSDTWPAWRRSIRLGLRQFRLKGPLRPEVLLSAGLFLLIVSVAVGEIALLQTEVSVAQEPLSIALVPGVTDAQVQDVYSGLQQTEGVMHVSFISHDQALTSMRTAHPDIAAFLDHFHLQNPFRDRMDISLTDSSAIAGVRLFLSQERLHGVVDPGFIATMADREQFLDSMFTMSTVAQECILTVGIVALLLLLCLVMHGIRAERMVRGQERETVVLLGGSSAFVDGPLFAELLLLLWAGVVLAACCVIIFFAAVPSFLSQSAQTFIGDLQTQLLTLLPILIPALILFAPVCVLIAFLFTSSARRHA